MSLGSLELDEMPTVDRPSVDGFHLEYVRAARPVRIRGAIADWPALGRWSPDDFAARFGDVLADAYAMEAGQIVRDRRSGFRIVRLTIREYVERLRLEEGKPRLYLRARLGELLPELMREVVVPRYCARRLALRQNLWFSGAGAVTALHFDLPHNLVAQVYGRKRFVVFPRAETRKLYPEPWLSSAPHLSRVDPESPDYARFPRLRRARGFACTLEPGDMLFIPSRSWHHARSSTTSISTNFWWATPLLYPLMTISDAYKRARRLNI